MCQAWGSSAAMKSAAGADVYVGQSSVALKMLSWVPGELAPDIAPLCEVHTALQCPQAISRNEEKVIFYVHFRLLQCLSSAYRGAYVLV